MRIFWLVLFLVGMCVGTMQAQTDSRFAINSSFGFRALQSESCCPPPQWQARRQHFAVTVAGTYNVFPFLYVGAEIAQGVWPHWKSDPIWNVNQYLGIAGVESPLKLRGTEYHVAVQLEAGQTPGVSRDVETWTWVYGGSLLIKQEVKPGFHFLARAGYSHYEERILAPILIVFPYRMFIVHIGMQYRFGKRAKTKSGQ